MKFKIIGLLIFYIIAIVLLFLPANYFDTGDSVCVSVVLFDVECYACGMTRAIQHLIHFDFKSAYNYNPLAFLVFPLVIYLIVTETIKVYKEVVIGWLFN